MEKLNKITGQLGNQTVINTALRHLDRMLGGEAQTLEHILSCYRQLPGGRSIDIVRYDISHNRVDAIIAITEEMNGTRYSWDHLSEMAGKYGRVYRSEDDTGRSRREFADVFDDLYQTYRQSRRDAFETDLNERLRAQREKERQEYEEERRRRSQRVIDLKTLNNVHDVTAKVTIVEERPTRNGDPFLVIQLTANDGEWYKITGNAYVFDRTTINAIRSADREHRLRISPSLDPDYPPRVRKIL